MMVAAKAQRVVQVLKVRTVSFGFLQNLNGTPKEKFIISSAADLSTALWSDYLKR